MSSSVYRSAGDGEDTGPNSGSSGIRHPVRAEIPTIPAPRPRRDRSVSSDLVLAGRDGPSHTPGALLAREHELARWRAAHIAGETAAAELAERLSFAHRHAGKPSLTKLSIRVGYSKGTLSKVLSGKMPPTWGLVRKLGEHLRVPPQLVTQEWLPLWIAAVDHREAMKEAQKTAEAIKEAQKKAKENDESEIARGTAPVPPPPSTSAALVSATAETEVLNGVDPLTGTAPPADMFTGETGYVCPKCGAWVVDTTQHTDWHMQREPAGRPAPDAESTGATRANTTELALLKEALSPPEDN